MLFHFFFREIALEILQQEEIGSFIVRDSSTHPGCYALSVRVPKFENPTGISHYLILKTQRGVKLKVMDQGFQLRMIILQKICFKDGTQEIIIDMMFITEASLIMIK
jgi:hypothetical protein